MCHSVRAGGGGRVRGGRLGGGDCREMVGDGRTCLEKEQRTGNILCYWCFLYWRIPGMLSFRGAEPSK